MKRDRMTSFMDFMDFSLLWIIPKWVRGQYRSCTWPMEWHQNTLVMTCGGSIYRELHEFPAGSANAVLSASCGLKSLNTVWALGYGSIQGILVSQRSCNWNTFEIPAQQTMSALIASWRVMTQFFASWLAGCFQVVCWNGTNSIRCQMDLMLVGGFLAFCRFLYSGQHLFGDNVTMIIGWKSVDASWS